jgi:hypothetical protein
LPVKSCKGGEEKKETSQNLYIQIKSWLQDEHLPDHQLSWWAKGWLEI